ncbi:ComEC/Rec2 family competence protein [Adlercreutzia aquisgranensis]|uniref:ComEC/Rec2 family competence protein n=1 Tax=Adlercreutzia aquisgranensis TaxID=2941323 RepID=UPI0020407204|nr:ComEC/Rec2 family competence protein [Adlercreutzia aquisgranensis]
MAWQSLYALGRRLRKGRERGDAPSGVRPSIPLALAAGLAFWAACACAVSAGEHLGAGGCMLLALGCAAAALAALPLLRAPRGAYAAAMLVATLAGALNGAAGSAMLHAQGEVPTAEAVPFVLRAVEDGSETAYGRRVLAQVEEGFAAGAKVQVLFGGDADVLHGQRFVAEGSLQAVSGSSAEFLWGKGCVLQLGAQEVEHSPGQGVRDAVAAVRAKAVERIGSRGGQDAALVAALACGWRGSIDDELSCAFKAAGLSHLIAVSGAHLSLVVAFASAVLGALRCPRAAAVPLQAALILSFLLLSAASASAVRASIMAFCAMGSFFARRRPSSLSALGVCMMVFVALDPFVAVSVSFALSTLSTLGIVLFGRLFQCWIARAMRWAPRFARDALALTLASNVAATLYGSALFSQLSLVAPVSNVVAAPLFAPSCIGSVAVSLLAGLLPDIPWEVLQVGCVFPGILARAVRACAAVPYASVAVSWSPLAALAASGAIAAALYRLWPVPAARPQTRTPVRRQLAGVAAFAAACALTMLLGVAVAPGLFGGDRCAQMVMLDVGQGDAILLRGSEATVLVDTGNKPALLRQALARNGVTSLDAVVITHSDDDHFGCLADLKGVVQVPSVMVAEDGLSCPCASCETLRSDAEVLVGRDGLVGLSAGDRMEMGSMSLEVLWPVAYCDEGGNGDSLCLLVLVDADGDGATDYRGLLTGDAERGELASLVQAGALGPLDVLKVGHHGSKNALDERTVRSLDPTVSLISCGDNNRYGHPSAEALALLEEAGSEVFRTDVHGDVACRFDSDGMEVR